MSLWNNAKRSRVTLTCLGFCIIAQSVALAEENSQTAWSDRSDSLLVNSHLQPSNINALPAYKLPSFSRSGNNAKLDFTVTELPDLLEDRTTSLSVDNSDRSIDTSDNSSENPALSVAQSDNLPADIEVPKADKKWFFTIYGGTGTNSSLGQTLTGKTSEFYDSFFNGENYIGLEVGRKITDLGNSFQLEVTGQARQHFNEASYLALETALVLRWHIARNSNFLNASLAVGDGLSYVTDLPQVEANRPNTFEKSNLLNYLLIETAFSLPKNPDWSLVLRLNHRSGVFGVFNGARDGSNNLSLGIRHSF